MPSDSVNLACDVNGGASGGSGSYVAIVVVDAAGPFDHLPHASRVRSGGECGVVAEDLWLLENGDAVAVGGCCVMSFHSKC